MIHKIFVCEHYESLQRRNSEEMSENEGAAQRGARDMFAAQAEQEVHNVEVAWTENDESLEESLSLHALRILAALADAIDSQESSATDSNNERAQVQAQQPVEMNKQSIANQIQLCMNLHELCQHAHVRTALCGASADAVLLSLLLQARDRTVQWTQCDANTLELVQLAIAILTALFAEHVRSLCCTVFCCDLRFVQCARVC